MVNQWQSNTLNTFEDADHCRVCAFLAGSRNRTDLMEVIRVLDLNLAEAEEGERRLMEVVATLNQRIADLTTPSESE